MQSRNAGIKTIGWIAWRNLISRKNRHGLSFMTYISILGVAIGVAALIIVLSVMGGFEQDLKTKMLKGEPHLEIMSTNQMAGFSLDEYALEEFRSQIPDATGIEPFTQADVVLKHGKHMSTVVIFGVSTEQKGHLWGFYDAIIEGELADIGTTHLPVISQTENENRWPGIVLGESLAIQLGANLGDEMIVLSPQSIASSSMLTGGTLSRNYVVVGIFRTNLFNYDSKWAVVSLDEGRKFMIDYDPSLDEDSYVTGIAVNVDDPYNIEKSTGFLKNYPSLQGKTWKDTNSALLYALKLEKFTMGSILMLIVLVAAFSISGTMMMTVFHKKRQVSLLRSLGMSRADITRLFLMQGFTVGTIGIICGLILGLGFCSLIYSLRYTEIPISIFHYRALPVKFLPIDYSLICLFAWLLSIVGATYPALMAAKQDPSSGLRYS